MGARDYVNTLKSRVSEQEENRMLENPSYTATTAVNKMITLVDRLKLMSL
jgi:hypothetical protein